MALCECQHKNSLGQIGLSLGILSNQQVDGSKRIQPQMLIIAVLLQLYAVYKHAVTSLYPVRQEAAGLHLGFLLCDHFKRAFSVHLNDIPRV